MARRWPTERPGAGGERYGPFVRLYSMGVNGRIRWRAAAIGLLVASLAASCGSGSGTHTSSGTPPTSKPAGSATTTTPISPTTTSVATATTTPPPTSPATTVPVRAADCLTSQLQVTVSAPNGAAGHVDVTLGFRNRGSAACILDGFPGVSYVAGPSGRQVGAPAARVPTSYGPVRLAPGDSAHAALQETDPTVYTPGRCHLVRRSGLRVYPPNQRAAAFVVQAGQACGSTVEQQLQIEPVQAGPTAA